MLKSEQQQVAVDSNNYQQVGVCKNGQDYVIIWFYIPEYLGVCKIIQKDILFCRVQNYLGVLLIIQNINQYVRVCKSIQEQNRDCWSIQEYIIVEKNVQKFLGL